MPELTDEVIDCIKRWEGLRLEAYQDQAGVWTIGYGHTSRAGPPAVTAGMKITEAEAEAILRRDLVKFEEAVRRLVKVPLSDCQYGTLVSFAMNVGPDEDSDSVAEGLGDSTLLRKLNAGDYAAVPGELAKWNKVTDPRTGKLVVSNGLVNRRAAEAGLWVRGAHVAGRDVPAVPVPRPPIRPETIGAIGTLAAALGTALAQLAQIDGPVQYAVAAAIVAGTGYGVWWAVRRARAAT